MSARSTTKGSTKNGSKHNEEAEFPSGQSDGRRRSLRLQQQSVAKRPRLDLQAMNPTETLLSAIRSFDVDKVDELMKSDFEIQYRNSNYYSVLHFAAAQIDTGTRSSVRVRGLNESDTFVVAKKESNKHLNPSFRPEALRRIIEIFLKSGRFNVNALTDSCETALHHAAGYCKCKLFTDDDYKDMVNDIIKLLLKNNANINAKTSNGETPIMRASYHGCSHIVQILLNWKDEFGARVVDLNARDIDGETALIKAAKWARFEVVELLLQHGCLDNVYDHRGFYAMHAVIYGSQHISKTSSDFLALFAELAAKTAAMVLQRYAAYSKRGNSLCIEWITNDAIQETMNMLVKSGQANINSIDFRGDTVLDVALKSKLRINQETIKKLKEYGATSKHPEYPEITLKYTDKLGKTPLHNLSADLPELSLSQKAKIFDFTNVLNKRTHIQEFQAMTVAKDHKARTVLHYAVQSTGRSVLPEDIRILINVLKLKSFINERDNYDRTPLHYCEDDNVYKSLVEQGANEHIEDIYGKTPRGLNELRKKEDTRYNMTVDDHLNHDERNAWMIWRDCEYAFRDRDQFSDRICDKIRQFMNRLSDEIGKRDPRFECRSVLVGSAREGTKTGLPDEFDFNFILTKLSEVCEVVPSPEAPSGFVHLKRKRSNNVERQDDIGRLFNSDGFLLTTEIGCMFRILYLQLFSEPNFWADEDFFEWGPCSEAGMVYIKEEKMYRDPDEVGFKFCSTIELKLNRSIEGRYMFKLISLDIVPCIKINGWWPEEALSGVNDEIKSEGCHLVLDQPQRNYPWVPFSDPFARISFAPAESRIIKDCSAVAKAAYMVGKQLLSYHDPKLTYVLKTCLLYCIEALTDYGRSSLTYEDIDPTELEIYVEKLMFCFHEFQLQDFLPCHLMPSFHVPIEEYLKSNHDKLMNDSSFTYPAFAYVFYREVCTKESPGDFCPPTPEPLDESFNKEDLLSKLSMSIL